MVEIKFGKKDLKGVQAIVVGKYLNAIPDARKVPYDNAESGLDASNIQEAVDEIAGKVGEIDADISTIKADVAELERGLAEEAEARIKGEEQAKSYIDCRADDLGRRIDNTNSGVSAVAEELNTYKSATDERLGSLEESADALEWSLGNKQDMLVPGENIKTINGESLIGEGNIEITGGEGVKIVSSVDELDLNAPQGTLASVAINTVAEVPFSELYQPTSDEVNLGAGVVNTTNLSRVHGISVNSSYDTTAEIPNFMVYLFSKDFDMQGGVGQLILLGLGAAMTMDFSTQEENELELFTANEDGIITVNEGNLAIINNLLSSTEFVYGGVQNMDNGELSYHPCVDMFYKTIGGISKTELYIKDVNGWRVVSDEELKAKVDNLQTIVDNLDLIVNSVDELPQNVPLGSLARVLALKTSAIPVSKDVEYGKTVKEFVWSIPEKLSEELLELYKTSTIDIMFNETTQLTSIAFTNWYNRPALTYTAHYTAVPKVIASYSTEGNLLAFNESGIEYINSITKTYKSKSVSEHFDIFLSVPRPKNWTYLYTKNELGWEQYSELVGQSVTTEKVADGAITMEKLAEDVKEAINNAIRESITNTLNTEV